MATRTLENLYDFYRYIVRKERGVFVTTQQFTANLDTGQMDAVAEWFAPYGSTQVLHDALRKIKTYTPIFSDIFGYVTLPTNYIHLLGTPFIVNGSTVVELNFVNESEFVFALNSQQRPVSTAAPIAFDTLNGFKMFPEATYQMWLNYLKRPNTPVYGYTQVGRTITYNPLTSTELEFSDIYFNHIIAKALKYAGINMNEEGVYKFADQYEKET